MTDHDRTARAHLTDAQGDYMSRLASVPAGWIRDRLENSVASSDPGSVARFADMFAPTIQQHGRDCHRAGYEAGHAAGVAAQVAHQQAADLDTVPSDTEQLRAVLRAALRAALPLASSVGVTEDALDRLVPAVIGYTAQAYRAGEAAGHREERRDRAAAHILNPPEPLPEQVGQVVIDRERLLDAGLRALAARATVAEDWSSAADLYAVLSEDRRIPDLVNDEPYVPEWDDLPHGDLD